MHRSLDRDSTTAVDTCAPIIMRFMQLRVVILSEQISKHVMSSISPPFHTSSTPISIPICANLGQFMSSYSGTQQLTCPGILEVYH